MSLSTQREMLEAAIAADFDDMAAHAAYADLLAEEGDPRGEYIQLHLALENKDQSPRLLAQWRERAHRLLQAHQRDWLGKLAPFLLDRKRSTVEPDTPNIEFTFRRGWLAELHVQDVRDAFTRVLADAPEARMLQVLTLRNTRLPNNHGTLEPLVGSPCLGTLKTFALGDPEAFGCTADGQAVTRLVRGMSLLRELDLRAQAIDIEHLFAHPFPLLRILSADFLPYLPVAVLAGNKTLMGLERLFLSIADERRAPIPEGITIELTAPLDPSDLPAFLIASQFGKLTDLTLRTQHFGDQVCAAIARSGILRRLKRLDLRNCWITDAGAEALARSPDLRHLEWLDVGGNRITPMGVSRLQEADVRVQWDSNWGDYPEPGDDGDYYA